MTTPLADGAYAMGEEILRRINKIAAGVGVTVPDRQVICSGGAAVECEQIAVMLTGWTPMGNEVSAVCQRIWGANITVVIIRKAPAMPDQGGRRAASPAAVNDGGALASNDADILVALADTLDVVGDGLLVTIQAPEGGYQATELAVVLSRVGGLG